MPTASIGPSSTKGPVFRSETLGPDTSYPVKVAIPCNVLATRSSTDMTDMVKISVAPWGLESLDGRIEFEVRADQLTAN